MQEPLEPEPMKLADLLDLPAFFGFATACQALRISEARGRKMLAAGTFPLHDKGHGGRVALFALADLLRYGGFDPSAAISPGAGGRETSAA